MLYMDNENTTSAAYILMQDLTSKFRRPCIVDIKIGQQTYLDTASDEKKRYEISKNPYQRIIGFRISGMKVYRHSAPSGNVDAGESQNIESGFYVKYDRKWSMGRKPGKETKQTLEEFFFDGKRILTHIIPLYIEKLKTILDIFHRQTKLKFTASSLLLMYESDEGELEKASQRGDPVPIECKLIDFAHTHYIKEPNTRDEVGSSFFFGVMGCICFAHSHHSWFCQTLPNGAVFIGVHSRNRATH